jgi:hypothetical protein
MKLGSRFRGRPWTPAEDAELLSSVASKTKSFLIARKLGRTIVAVNDRVRALEAKGKPRLKRSKGTWYVSLQFRQQVGERSSIRRSTETFPDEREAKAFAKTKLSDDVDLNAGTLNPYLPKRTVTSQQLPDWLNEPDL